MPAPRYRFEPLGAQHDRAEFSCGVEALDCYFREQAGQELRRASGGTARIFVLMDRGTAAVDWVAGYYTLSAFTVELRSLPPAFSRRLARYPNVPAILLGRLAVDTRYRGQGLGELLLFDALRRAFGVVEAVAAVAMVVDAKDDRARAFYERYGFERLLDNDYQLFIPMGTVAQLVAETGP